MEHRFAAIVFPGIIYDILVSDTTDSTDLLKRGKYYAFHKDSPVGFPFSLANQILTRCFSNILRPSLQHIYDDVSNEGSDGKRSYSDSRAVRLIVEVLDMIRQISESRFQSLSFKPNLSINDIQGKFQY